MAPTFAVLPSLAACTQVDDAPTQSVTLRLGAPPLRTFAPDLAGRAAGARSVPSPRDVVAGALGALDDFEVLGEIARGGMGAVFVARRRATGERCALKVLDPQFAVHPDLVARLRDELTVSQRARHHGLLQIEAFARSADGVPYLVMELLDGETLASLLERGRLELGAAAAIGAQVASAVAALHVAGVVHCDLKPDNLHVLYEAGVAGWPFTKVLDYGVARMLDAVVEDEPSIAGTPAYMSPEQWRGEACPGSDVYALGCVLYELCTGQTPFAGTLAELMTAHLEALPIRAAVRRPGLLPELDRVISRMLSKDPALRPRMAEIARQLAVIAEAHPSPQARPLRPRSAWSYAG